MSNIVAFPPRSLSVLVIGANGYLGHAICRAFLRAAGPDPSAPNPFKVYGLVRRPSAARDLAAHEVIPIVGHLDDRDTLLRGLLSYSSTWNVIVVCTEPAKTDPVAEGRHWRDVLALVQGLAGASARAFVSPARPLVLWSSGCKDYGMTGLHGAPNVEPHIETSPLDPPSIIRGRTEAALRVLDMAGEEGGMVDFEVAVVRATPVFGYSGSYFGAGFEYVADFAAATHDQKDGNADNKVLMFTADADTIMHSVHVDDCADAYVALAKTALFSGSQKSGSSAVASQIFNVSGRRYETLREVGAALAAEYGFTGGARFAASSDELPGTVDDQGSQLVFGWSQWVSSEKIRAVTGWSDRRPLFSENVRAYRLAYQAARDQGSDNVESIKRRMAGNWGDE